MKKQIWKRLPVILFILISGSCYSCGNNQDSGTISLTQESDLHLLTESLTLEAAQYPETESANAFCYVYV